MFRLYLAPPVYLACVCVLFFFFFFIEEYQYKETKWGKKEIENLSATNRNRKAPGPLSSWIVYTQTCDIKNEIIFNNIASCFVSSDTFSLSFQWFSRSLCFDWTCGFMQNVYCIIWYSILPKTNSVRWACLMRSVVWHLFADGYSLHIVPFYFKLCGHCVRVRLFSVGQI